MWEYLPKQHFCVMKACLLTEFTCHRNTPFRFKIRHKFSSTEVERTVKVNVCKNQQRNCTFQCTWYNLLKAKKRAQYPQLTSMHVLRTRQATEALSKPPLRQRKNPADPLLRSISQSHKAGPFEISSSGLSIGAIVVGFAGCENTLSDSWQTENST